MQPPVIGMNSQDRSSPDSSDVSLDGGQSMADSKDEVLKVYEQLCSSYRAIDDFRSKLLALLPLATGGGIFLLASDKAKADVIPPYLKPIGVFGLVVTLGLFLYELHGILTCTRLIEVGASIEESLEVNRIPNLN